MEGCFVEFSAESEASLVRTIECVNYVAALKRDGALNDEHMAAELSAEERAYFWDPTPEELQEWNGFWFNTPLAQRHSPDMAIPGWDFGSMVDAIANAEFEITGIATENGRCYFTFEPSAYPYCGSGCLVALLESLGNKVLAVEDGTGVVPYVQGRRWRPARDEHAGAPRQEGSSR